MAKFREVMNVREASQYLGLSKETLYKYLGEERIPAFKLGSRWRLKKDVLDRWMERESRQQLNLRQARRATVRCS
ncbi:MAG: helix-turn-helix domain-containing protein [Terriglobia bacterium]